MAVMYSDSGEYTDSLQADGKVCKSCGEIYPHSEFRDKRNECRYCERKKDKCRKSEYRKSYPNVYKDYYKKNKHHCLTVDRIYRKKNYEKIQIRVAIDRTNATGAGGELTVLQWRKIKAFFNNKCLCCGSPEKVKALSLDHIIPVVKGGSSDPSNIQPLCTECNSKKGDKETDYRILPFGISAYLEYILDTDMLF